MSQPASGWFTAKLTALRVVTRSNINSPIYGREVYSRAWVGLLIDKPCGLGESDGTR